MTHLETIRAACVKANPSILDLKMGCLIEDERGEAVLKGSYYLCAGSKDIYQSVSDNHIIVIKKILGRPIRLADVLVAIDAKCLEVAIECDGWRKERGENEWETIGNLRTRWNLLSDDLRLQSEKTLSFIANLLK